MTLVSDVTAQARALLNDIAAQQYTDTVLIPFIAIAGDELSTELNDNGIPVINAAANNNTDLVAVPTGTRSIALTGGPPTLPADFYIPLELAEMDVGLFNGNPYNPNYVEMRRQAIVESEDQTTDLQVWDWNNQSISFRGATSDRSVRIRYQRLLPTYAASGDTINVINAKTFLAARIAALAAACNGEDYDRASPLADYAKDSLDKLISVAVSDLQSLPVRRKMFRRKLWRY